MADKYSIQDLLTIMKSLRDPNTGCSWDQVQTFQTIVPYTIEEAYEVADAIARDDKVDLCDELGDLLLQVVYHAQIAEEMDDFRFEDVVQAICEKMTRRHPHVFGNEEQIKSGKQDWEQLKRQEHAAKCGEVDTSAIANIANGLPPLLRARKLQKKAAKVGFDWSDVNSVVDKLHEELGELDQEIKQGCSFQRIEDEIGDVLFSVVNLCRHVNLDADIALQKANKKFEQRFRLMERLCESGGKQIDKLTEEELDSCWNDAKQSLSE